MMDDVTAYIGRVRLRELEQAAEAFNQRYGITGAWSDEKLNQALADHGWPALADLPDTAQGIMRGTEHGEPPHTWQRVNAAHLLGHTIAHNGRRCPSCENW